MLMDDCAFGELYLTDNIINISIMVIPFVKRKINKFRLNLNFIEKLVASLLFT
jgi:hypothetical protein